MYCHNILRVYGNSYWTQAGLKETSVNCLRGKKKKKRSFGLYNTKGFVDTQLVSQEETEALRDCPSSATLDLYSVSSSSVQFLEVIHYIGI